VTLNKNFFQHHLIVTGFVIHETDVNKEWHINTVKILLHKIYSHPTALMAIFLVNWKPLGIPEVVVYFTVGIPDQQCQNSKVKTVNMKQHCSPAEILPISINS